MNEKRGGENSPEKQISIKQSPNLETIDHDKGKQPNTYLNGQKQKKVRPLVQSRIDEI